MRLVETSTVNLSTKTPTTLAGEFASFDTLNQNGRVYPAKVYEAALESLQEKVKSRSLLGECDHPLTYDEVRLSNVSHVITEMHVENTPDGHKRVMGEVELLDTPAGKIVQSLVEAGIPIGISSRATGDAIEENGHERITELNLITYDLVADPSFKTAVLSESSKSKLGESLDVIVKGLPLRESKEYDPIRKMANSIRESLLRDSTEQIHIDVASEEITVLRDLLEQRIAALEKSQSSVDILRESLLDSSRTSRSLRSKLQESTTRLSSLRKNMLSLQEAYNKLVETSTKKSDYDKLLAETVELRKKYAVESRGLTYSQVREFLEGATTTEEIEKRLTSLSRRKNSTPVVEGIKNIIVSDKSKRLEEAVQGRSTSLSSIISRI